MANLIADRATDEVIEALTRYRRGLDIDVNKIVHMDSAETPDIVRSRSSQDSMGFLKIRDSDLPHHVLDSPTVRIFSLEIVIKVVIVVPKVHTINPFKFRADFLVEKL